MNLLILSVNIVSILAFTRTIFFKLMKRNNEFQQELFYKGVSILVLECESQAIKKSHALSNRTHTCSQLFTLHVHTCDYMHVLGRTVKAKATCVNIHVVICQNTEQLFE